MSDFKELIKTFAKSRDYVRDFFVYGFKTRDEFNQKSARTYDNERRRIESWLSGFTRSDYASKVKNISLAIDSNTLDTNPLYQVWKAKSFTNNDIMLHFYILDYLKGCDSDTCQTVDLITDNIIRRYGILLDSQSVRRKCNEYVKEGLLHKKKCGREISYNINSSFANIYNEYPAILDAIKFYQLASPLGIIGSTILDNADEMNHIYHVKHSFFVHTLEDEVLLSILSAIKERCNIRLLILSSKNDVKQIIICTPLQIFVSTRTGRRYLCIYKSQKKRFFNIRLDTIKQVDICNTCDDFDTIYNMLINNQRYVWGVSFQSDNSHHLDELRLTLRINPQYESHILTRLKREGKGGIIAQLDDYTYQYSIKVFDVNEMKPWIRTFTGRIIDIWCTNDKIVNTLKYDMREMYNLYDIGTKNTNGE